MYAYKAAAVVQEEGGIVAIVDPHSQFNPEEARDCGCDMDTLLISQPEGRLQMAETIEMLLDSKAVALVVVI